MWCLNIVFLQPAPFVVATEPKAKSQSNAISYPERDKL